MRDFERLVVWQEARAFRRAVFEETRSFPAHELYDLTSQLRRSARSIGANIAEGSGPRTDADFARFIGLAVASADETLNHLIDAWESGYLSESTYLSLRHDLVLLRKRLIALHRRLRR